MKRIKEENIIVGDFIYIMGDGSKSGSRDRIYVLQILSKLNDVNWWKLKNISQKKSIFDPIIGKGICRMREEDWKMYEIYGLDKEESDKLNRLFILERLK